MQLRLPELENVGMSLLAGQTPTSAETIETLLARIKDGLLTSFGTLLAQYSDDVRRMDAQRITLGWNYGQFFALKVPPSRGRPGGGRARGRRPRRH